MASRDLPAPPRQAQGSTALAIFGLAIVIAGLVVGIVLATDALDSASFESTRAWLFPLSIVGIGSLLVGVILRFAAILDSIRLRLAAMRDYLPNLIQRGGEIHEPNHH